MSRIEPSKFLTQTFFILSGISLAYWSIVCIIYMEYWNLLDVRIELSQIVLFACVGTFFVGFCMIAAGLSEDPRSTLEIVFTWPDGRKEVRYRRHYPSEDANELITQVKALQERLGEECPYSYEIG